MLEVIPNLTPNLETQIDEIFDHIEHGRCVPFLGAGVNVSNVNYKGLPLGRELARAFFEALKGNKEKIKYLEKLTKQLNINSDELLKLVQSEVEYDSYQKCSSDAERIACLLSEWNFSHKMEGNLALLSLSFDLLRGRKSLLRFVEGVINDTECEPSPLLCTLARLPLKLIITTNYDCLMERALDKFGKDYKVIEQPLKGFGGVASRKKNDELVGYNGIIIYKIHGSFCHQSSSETNIVITEEDYIQLLTFIREDIMGLTLIQEKLVSSALLFLGYSLEDWDFRLIYKSLVENLDKDQLEKSFAIMNTASDIWKRYWDKKNVNILEMDIHDFASALYKKFIKDN